MSRRRLTLGLLAMIVAAGPVACSTRSDTPDTAASPPTTTSSPPTTTTAAPAPATAPTTPSASVSPVPVVPPAGRAPVQAFAVGTRRLTLSRGAQRPLPTTVWYPANGTAGGDPAPGLPAAAGRFPLVLFSHGLTAAPSDYAAMLARWAQAGFVVAAPAYPHTATGVARFDPLDVVNQPADATQVITDVLALAAASGDPLNGRIDVQRVAAVGHSAGGITTVGLLTATRDDRLDAAIVLAGQQVFAAPFTGPPAAVLFVHGRLDRTVAYRDGLATFKSVPWSRAMLTITDGGHVTTGRDFEVTVGTSTEFLRWSLYGDAAAKARIPAAAVRRGVTTFTDQL